MDANSVSQVIFFEVERHCIKTTQMQMNFSVQWETANFDPLKG